MALCSVASAGGDPLGRKKPDFLPVDQAFELQPLVWKDDGTLEVSWRIAREYYLYRDKLKFTAKSPSLKLGKPALPASLPHEDEHFGVTQIYRDKLVVTLSFGKEAKGPVSVTVGYQGCADAGLCYPPQTRTIEAGN
ncbi:MAG: protein-disulfide reductase DsbD domain-containing protein [Gammaproteobacteria bacterium]